MLATSLYSLINLDDCSQGRLLVASLAVHQILTQLAPDLEHTRFQILVRELLFFLGGRLILNLLNLLNLVDLDIFLGFCHIFSLLRFILRGLALP